MKEHQIIAITELTAHLLEKLIIRQEVIMDTNQTILDTVSELHNLEPFDLKSLSNDSYEYIVKGIAELKNFVAYSKQKNEKGNISNKSGFNFTENSGEA